MVLPASATAHGQTAAVVVYGPVKSDQRDVVASTIQQTLRAASWTVPDSPLTPREYQSVVACVALDRPWPCISATARSKGLDHVLVIHLEPDKVNQGLVLTGQVLVASDAVPSTDRGWCAKCTNALLITSAAELANLMLQHSAARAPRSSGAVNPAAVQPAKPVDRPLETPIRIPTAAEPASTSGSPMPSPQADASAEPPATTSSVWTQLVPALMIGGGVAALGTGAYLSYDAEANTSGPQSKYVYSGPGIALAAVGGAAVGVGLYLLFRHPEHHSQSSRASAPILSGTPGGAMAGWMANF